MTDASGRLRPPEAHGEVLCEPPLAGWATAMRRNTDAVGSWPASLRGIREQARAEARAEAAGYSDAIGVEGRTPGSGEAIVATGHQPELYHPGVWVKDFLVDRFAMATGALGLDVVVDTDAARAVSLRSPRMGETVTMGVVELAPADASRAYVQLPPPDTAARTAFRVQGDAQLATLPDPGPRARFAAFCDALDVAAEGSPDLATAMTAARRRYEAPACTRYLELPISRQARSASFARFAWLVLTEAERFRTVFNDALADFRRTTGTRSSAQPFPDLGMSDHAVELPFWLLVDGGRHPAWLAGDGTLQADGRAVCAAGTSPDALREALGAAGATLAPRAIALSMYERLFVADLFVHGTGGGRYDIVTDMVIRGFLGIEPPVSVIASMTMQLPLHPPAVDGEGIEALERRLQRLEHNPDESVDDVVFSTPGDAQRAAALVEEKRRLKAAIAEPGADRKALGARIRETNAALGVLMAPFAQAVRDELARANEREAAAAILADRTYPYVLWDPAEIAGAVARLPFE